MRFAFFLVAACAACNAIDGADQYKKVDSGPQPGCDSSCLTTAESCLAQCTSTHDSCVAGCNNPPCVKSCDSAQTSCTATCTNDCTSCGCSMSQCTTFDAGID